MSNTFGIRAVAGDASDDRVLRGDGACAPALTLFPVLKVCSVFVRGVLVFEPCPRCRPLSNCLHDDANCSGCWRCVEDPLQDEHSLSVFLLFPRWFAEKIDPILALQAHRGIAAGSGLWSRPLQTPGSPELHSCRWYV